MGQVTVNCMDGAGGIPERYFPLLKRCKSITILFCYKLIVLEENKYERVSKDYYSVVGVCNDD